MKGRTENALLKLPFKGAFMFRTGALRPMHGAVSKTRFYRLLYAFMAPAQPDRGPTAWRHFSELTAALTSRKRSIQLVSLAPSNLTYDKFGSPKRMLARSKDNAGDRAK